MNGPNAAPNPSRNPLAAVRDLGSIAWHSLRESRFETKLNNNAENLADAQHDIDFYGEHAEVLDAVVGRDFDGRNVFYQPRHEQIHTPLPGKSGFHEARILEQTGVPFTSPIPAAPSYGIEVDATRRPGQAKPRNTRQRREEQDLAGLIGDIRAKRSDQSGNLAGVYRGVQERDEYKTIKAKLRHRKETKRAFKRGDIDAYEVRDRKAERINVEVGKLPRPINTQARQLDRLTKGARLSRGGKLRKSRVERLTAKAKDAQEEAKDLQDKRKNLQEKREDHQSSLAAARARQAARRR